MEAKDLRMAVLVWDLFTRDLHGSVPEVSSPLVEEEGGCMRRAKTKTQGGRWGEVRLLSEGKHKGRIRPHLPTLSPGSL
jgi:hypothetical protein